MHENPQPKTLLSHSGDISNEFADYVVISTLLDRVFVASSCLSFCFRVSSSVFIWSVSMPVFMMVLWGLASASFVRISSGLRPNGLATVLKSVPQIDST